MVKSVNEHEMGSTDESMTSASSPEGSLYHQQQFFHQNSQHLQQQQYFQMQQQQQLQNQFELRQQQHLHYQQQGHLRQYQVQPQQHYVQQHPQQVDQQVFQQPQPNHPGYHSRSRSGHGDRRPRSQKLLLPPPPSTTSSYPQSPTSPELDPSTGTLNGYPYQLPNLGPDQTYIISGPFHVNGQYTMMVYPIPKGATVFATPSARGDLTPPMNTFPAIRSPAPVVQSESQLEFSTPIPMQNPANPTASLPKSNFRPPCALIWNRHTCPEGRVMPLRQSQPPVYFYQASEDGMTISQQPETVT